MVFERQVASLVGNSVYNGFKDVRRLISCEVKLTVEFAGATGFCQLYVGNLEDWTRHSAVRCGKCMHLVSKRTHC